MHEPEPDPDAAPWSFLNVDNIFNNNYYGDNTQHDMRISHEQYIRDSPVDAWYNSTENDESIALALLEEELTQLSMSEFPDLSHPREGYFQNSTADPNWHDSSNNYYCQEGDLHKNDDARSLCSSPEDRSSDGDNYSYPLEITDEPELDEEVRKWLMNPVPHIPRINGDIPSADEATIEHQRLLDRLELYGFIEHKVLSDGNCQFSALSDQIYGDPVHHDIVRQKVVHQLKAHPELYERFVIMGSTYTNYTEYLEKMSKSKEWGDHITLQAAADYYGMLIRLITTFRDPIPVKIPPKEKKSEKVLYLSFWSEVHYNSLHPRGSPEALKLNLLPSDSKRKKKWWSFGNKP